MELILPALLLGIGATALTDAWSLIRTPLMGVAFPNFAYVGRWAAHFVHGRFRHESIAAATPVPGELAIGWFVHYAIGIAFAWLLLLIVGAGWLRAPTPGPALLLGLTTVAAPYFILQPGMGVGIAASRAPNPNAARLQALLTHLVFGVGLYVAARLLELTSRG